MLFILIDIKAIIFYLGCVFFAISHQITIASNEALEV